MKIEDYNIDNLSLYYDSELVELRKVAREQKNWYVSDKIREYLDSRSIIIMDTKDGQEIYYAQDGTKRADIVERINRDKRLNAIVDAWIYTQLSKKHT
jgi:L-lactate utilization protein LutB